MKQYITNKARTIFLPYEEGLIEWLTEKYPFSKYHIVKVE